MKRILSFVLCAAMLLSSIVFVVSAADSQVQAVINKINAIGEVHRNEALLDNISVTNGWQFNKSLNSDFGYNTCYYRVDYPNSEYSVNSSNWQKTLMWDRPFQISFQFAIKDHYPTSYFGGCLGNVAWVGYMFSTNANNDQRFFIAKSDGEGPSKPSTICVRSNQVVLDPNRLYTMTAVFDSTSIRVYLDGELMCDSINASRPTLKLKFTPNPVSYVDPWGPQNNFRFHLYPANTISYIKSFEAVSLDGTINVHSLEDNIAANDTRERVDYTISGYLDSKYDILDAKAAYMALTPPQKKEVTNYSTLVEKLREYYNLQPAYGTENAISAEALAVVDLIDAIGIVDSSSESDIYTAEIEYEALDPEVQAEVYNYDVLLCSREEFDALSDPAVTQLIADINAIAPVTLDSGTAIVKAEADYAAFNPSQKALVSNYADLIAHRNTYDDLCVAHTRELILAIGKVTKESNAAVSLAKSWYNSLRDDLKARLADVKPIFDSAKTDMRILNLADLDLTTNSGAQETYLCNNYYQIQSAAAKALVENKAYLDQKILELTNITEAREIVKLVNRIGSVNFMQPGATATGFEFSGKSQVGYSNMLIIEPDGTKTTSDLYAPYKVSLDFMIKKWLNNSDDNTARIMGYTQDVAFGYNGVEKKFIIGNNTGFAGKSENPSGTYAESKVVELKLGVPYNITFEADEFHYAVYLNGKLMASTTEIGHKRGNYFIFYPGGLDMLITCCSFVHNGQVIADSVTDEALYKTSNRWWWVNNNGGWKNDFNAMFSDVYNDSGYQIETAYNRFVALPEEYKSLVTNAETLINKYNQYTATKNVQLVDDTIAAITAIGDPAAVTLDSLSAIDAAEYAYSEVPEAVKANVTNYADLVSARNNYDAIYAADFDARVIALGDLSADEVPTAEALKVEYDAMSDAQKALVTTLDALNILLRDCAEYNKAQPVIDAIYSFQGLKTVNYNDDTPIGGNVRVTDNNPYTHISKARDETQKPPENTGIIGTNRYKIDFDFVYTGYEDSTYAVVAGSNDSVLCGVDVAHGLAFIKNGSGPFGTHDPESYDAKASFTFRTNRWYHVTFVYDANRISVEVDGEEKVHLNVESSGDNPWWIMKPLGGVHGYVDNITVATLVPADELDEGFVREVTQEFYDSDSTTIEQTTIGQWNRNNVAKARAMYNALSPLARTAVTNYKTLSDTERLLGMSAPSDAAMAVIDAINLLNKDSTIAQVNDAQALYDALSDTDKAAVTNYARIDEVRKLLENDDAVNDVIAMINALTDASSVADIKAARDAYNDLPETKKGMVNNYDHIAELFAAKAQAVIDMISALTLDSELDAITAASNAYDELPDDIKPQVTNYDALSQILTERESHIAVANVQALINAIDENSDYETCKAAEEAYAALNDEQKAQITGYDKIAARYAAIAKVVEDKIAALTTASSDADIQSASIAYETLPDELKALVTNYAHLEEIKASHVSAAATEVIEMIMEIDVNASADKLNAVLAAYNALSDTDKAAVWNYDTLLQIINDKAADITAKIENLPDAYYIDIYHYEKDVNNYLTDYNAFPAEVQAKVTNSDKLQAAADKIASLHEWNDNKKVNILNSTLEGFGKYTSEQLEEMASKTPIGIYYYFEEVDMIERGDSTTGYYSLEGDKENTLVKNEQYAKLDLDIKVTDVDLINGWPAFFKMTVSLENGWIGYDFVNKTFFYSQVGGGGGGGMDHGFIAAPCQHSDPIDFDFGVWHHMTLTCDGPSAVIEFDGVKVLDLETEGLYDFLIIYPWLCNLEMTNVHYYDKQGNDTLSPFRNAVNTPTGWSKSTNDSDATMLTLLEESIANAKASYNALTDDEKAQIVGYENIEKLENMIANAGKYAVVVEDGSADVEYAAEGDVITITAGEAPEGMSFDKWEIVSGEIELADVNAATTTFTMPASDVKVKAVFKEGSAVQKGDANGDGKINSKDVVAIMKAIVGIKVKGYNEGAADFDGNGKINSKDVIAVMRFIVAQ